MTQEHAVEKPRFFRDEDVPVLNEKTAKAAPLFVPDDDGDEEDAYVSSVESIGKDEEKHASDDSCAAGSAKETFYCSLQEVIGKDSATPEQLLSFWRSYGDLKDGIVVAANKYFEEKEASAPAAVERVVIDLSDEENYMEIQDVPPVAIPYSQKRTSSQAGFSSLPFSNSAKVSPVQREVEWTRFIGSIHAIGFATRPTVRPVPVGSRLGFKKALPKGTTINKSTMHAQHFSHLTRLLDIAQDRELGRIPEEIARIVYPLLDYSDEIMLEPYLLSNTGKRFSVGDDIYVRIDCYLTSNVFESSKRQNVGTTSFLNHHSMDNSQLHRATAIMALFDAINIQPVYGDITSENDCEDSQNSGSNGVNSSQFQEEALNINQLKTFYRITQSTESLKKLPETSPDQDLFKLELRRYQKQSLSWMLRREYEYKHLSKEAAEMSVDGNTMNPLWKKFNWPSNSKFSSDVSQADSRFFYANLYTGEFSVEMPVIKTMINGGILADEMGLGKTISALALICTAPYDTDYKESIESTKSLSIRDISAMSDNGSSPISTSRFDFSQRQRETYAYRTTLVIVPMSLLNQWQTEFEKANQDSKKRCEIYYGNNIKDFSAYVLGPNAPSVIITTYGIVQCEYGRNSSTGLFDVSFFRIVLDEGHTIRNRNTRTTKAIVALRSSRKWVLTGTPIINRLDDLFSLIKFLNLEPWSNISYWKRYVSTPFEKGKYEQAFDVINAVLEPVLLRRTKNMKDVDGKPLVLLPPKEVIVEKLQLSPHEKKTYETILKDAEKSVKEGVAKGDLLKNYSNILVHILRLRQACCHLSLLKNEPTDDPDLIDADTNGTRLISLMLNTEDSPSSPKQAVVTEQRLEALNKAFRELHDASRPVHSFECAICTTECIEPLSAVSVTECLHTFCEPCLAEYIEFQQKKGIPVNCPYCREPICEDKIFKLKEPVDPKVGYELVPFNSRFQSTKIRALLGHLKEIQETSPGEQVIVFSQFSSFLDILQSELISHFPRDQVRIYKFDGRLDLKERTRVLQQFNAKDLSCIKILLLSLKAGGVGLNLTCASRAFMMDPWWSPSMEDQAIDRIHRIGQQKTVKVIRFIIEGSVEEKMLRIQERKRMLGDVVDGDETERRQKRIEEIQMLFQ